MEYKEMKIKKIILNSILIMAIGCETVFGATEFCKGGWYEVEDIDNTHQPKSKYNGKFYFDEEGWWVEDKVWKEKEENNTKLGSTGNVVEDALNETAQFYFDNVYTYQANYRVKNKSDINTLGEIKKYWQEQSRGELNQAYRAGENALKKRQDSISAKYQSNPSLYTVDSFTHGGKTLEILLKNGQYTQDGEVFEASSTRGAYKNGSSVWGDDCSAFAGAFIETLCKKTVGHNLISASPMYCGSGQMVALGTDYFQYMNIENGAKISGIQIINDLESKFEFYCGYDLRSLKMKTGDIMSCYDSSKGKISHIEICAGSNKCIGWGKVRNQFESTTYGHSSIDGMDCVTYIDDNGKTRYVIGVARYKG